MGLAFKDPVCVMFQVDRSGLGEMVQDVALL